MDIHFNTGAVTPTEAKGIVTLLHVLHGDAVLPTILAPGNVTMEVVGDVMRYNGPADLIAKLQDGSSGGGLPTVSNVTHAGSAPEPASLAPEPTAEEAFGDALVAAGGTGGEISAEEAFGGDHMAATPPAAGERDKNGIPWDERIHSSSKGTNKDGTWARRRNTPDAKFDAVMAELRAANTAMTLQAATGVLPAPPPPPAPVAAAAAPPPPPATAPPPPPPAATGAIINFPNIMMKITSAQSAGTLTGMHLKPAMEAAGIDTVSALKDSEEARAKFHAKLVELGAFTA